jgi:hypothetical protein
MSPATCTWATCSSTRRATSSSAGGVCAATGCCGFQARITPALPRRCWWSARWRSEGKTRQQLGREAFVERVWEWRRHYGGAILGQMKRLGASVDWQREYFTMDDNLSVAVREAFARLYEQG